MQCIGINHGIQFPQDSLPTTYNIIARLSYSLNETNCNFHLPSSTEWRICLFQDIY